MSTHKWKLLAPLFLTSVVALPVHAQETDDTGFYLGAGVGVANVKDSEYFEDKELFQVYGGWQILPFLGIEGSFTDFENYGVGPVGADTNGWNLSVTGRLPITDRFALFAKTGPFWSDTDLSFAGVTDTYESDDWLFGAGVSFQATDNLDVRLAYDQVDIDLNTDNIDDASIDDFDAEFEMITLGINFRF